MGVNPQNIPTVSELSSSVIPQLQKRISTQVSTKRSNDILDKVPFKDLGEDGYDSILQWVRTLHLSVRNSPCSTAFLHASPNIPFLKMTDSEFTGALKTYLGGLPRKPDIVLPRCKAQGCPVSLQPAPVHDLACKAVKGMRATRHHLLKTALQRYFKTLHLSSSPVMEPKLSHYFRPPVPTPARFNTTRLDNYIKLGDREYLIDLVITSPPLSTRDLSAADQSAMTGERKKRAHYESLLCGHISVGSATIVPLAFSALGRASPAALEQISSFAQAASLGDKATYPGILRKMLEIISVNIWRGLSTILRAYRSTQDN
jgi:hypothetical protein